MKVQYIALLGVALTACSQATPASESALAVAANDPALKWGPCPSIFPAGCEIAVLHGDPSKPGADVFLRVPAKYRIPAHSHTSAERMILTSGELRVTYKGQPSATLAAGNYAYGPAKLPHDAECLSDEPCTLFIAFEGAVDGFPHDGTLE
jgi:quercetin dioxygenase-like cupin family protein